MVEFRILGSVEAVGDGGAPIAVGGPRHRRLLAVLVLHVGHVVPFGKLADALWDGTPPRDARSTTHVRVSELRRALRPIGVRVLTRDGGYQLPYTADEVDAGRFERHFAAGTAAMAGGDPGSARGHWESGLALWRGPALGEFAEELFARSAAVRLEELRLLALENLITADLELGRHGELVAQLEKLVVDEPSRERFRAQLMLALYRSGRQAEALRAYQAARVHLNERLAREPGEELQRLHQAMLTADPALHTATPDVVVVAAPLRAVPAQLPADVPVFIGRDAQLRQLDEMLLDRAGEPQPVSIAVIAGTAGVGKTALAIRWSHRHRERFPDGQLHVDLRGYDPEQPMAAADALARFLAALGVAGADIPLEVDERAGRFRTEIAGRRMLIVLDNASSVEQVRALLPGAAGCTVVVTSRDSMAGLVAREGAHRLDLDLFPMADAEALLHSLIGQRAADDPEAVSTLARQCSRLPLALRVAAELAVARSGTALATLVGELADQRRRLDMFDVDGDPRTAVPAVFSWSLRQLPADAGRMFRLAGLHPGAELDAHAAAALADVDLASARRSLETLTRAHLVSLVDNGRYGMHDLLRAYAAGLTGPAPAATGDRGPAPAAGHAGLTSEMDERTAALGRLFDYYLAAAAAAMDSLHPAEVHRRPRVEPVATPVPDLAEPDAARQWLDRERATLVAVAAHTAAHGWPLHTTRLSAIVERYLDGGHYADALALHGFAHEAAMLGGDDAALGRVLNSLGDVHFETGDSETAIGLIERAVELSRRAGDGVGEGMATISFARVQLRRGNLNAAADELEKALAVCRRARDHTGEGRALNILGVIDQRLDHQESALDRHEQALAIFERTGDQSGVAAALNNLGLVEDLLGRGELALEHFQRAMVISRELGERYGVASLLDNLAIAYLHLGRHQEATIHFRQSLAIFTEIGDREGQAWVRNGLGETAYAAGRLAEALGHFTTALETANAINAPQQQARAHTGLAHIHRFRADRQQARHHYEQALTLFANPESSDADDVRLHLAAIEFRS